MTEAAAGAIATIAFQKVFAHVQVWTLFAIATVAFVVVSAGLLLGHRQQARTLINTTKTDNSHSGSSALTVLSFVPSARLYEVFIWGHQAV